MSSSDRRKTDRRAVLGLLALGTFGLSGCLRPMLAEDGPAAVLRNRIAFPDVDGRFDYFLNKSLSDRLGKPKQTNYRLDVQTAITEQGLAIAQDNSVTRVTLQVKAYWALWRDGETAPLMSDNLEIQSGYSATTSLFATRQTRQDIERRLARDLGERIARAIMARSNQLET